MTARIANPARAARRAQAGVNGSATGALADDAAYTPESYLEAIAELVRAARDEEAIALVGRHGAAMLPQLNGEQLVHLSSMMEGAAAAVEATALVNGRHSS